MESQRGGAIFFYFIYFLFFGIDFARMHKCYDARVQKGAGEAARLTERRGTSSQLRAPEMNYVGED